MVRINDAKKNVIVFFNVAFTKLLKKKKKKKSEKQYSENR